MPLKYSFYSTREYYDELINALRKSGKGDSVRLASMGLKITAPEVRTIMEELASAAARGAAVSAAIDAYTFLNRDNRLPGPLFFSKRLPSRLPAIFAAKAQAIEAINQAGGSCQVINLPGRRFSNPVAGRNHIKLAIINRRVFIGGCNLDPSDRFDMMASFEDKAAAERLSAMFDKIMAVGSTSALGTADLSFELDNNSEIYIDAGVKKRSLIYQKAMELIDEAQESVYMFCQFFPYGETARHLAAAHHRGCDITLVFNHPAKHGRLHSPGHHFVIIKEKASAPRTFFEGRLPKSLPYLHAKLIATEQAAIMGSHNFVSAGVNLGTAEIALLSRSPDFAKNAVSCMNKQLAQYQPGTALSSA
jgi:phosphatidylserine/phosphatidylglycerophosphate/cardiolipin synthase-like enzyme